MTDLYTKGAVVDFDFRDSDDAGSEGGEETKTIRENEDHYTVTGYAAVFNNTDQGKDVILPGAFKKSLKEHGLPAILFQHKTDQAPIGICDEAHEKPKGLWVKARMPKADTRVSGMIIPQMKIKALKGMSIGYRIDDGGSERRKDGVRLLKSLRLYEASVVTMPMNVEAGIESVKSLVPYQNLPINRAAKAWDAEAAFKALRERFSDDDELRSAFLYADAEKSIEELDRRFLIGEVDADGCIRANHLALYKASAVVHGEGLGDIPEGAEELISEHLDRYFARLNLASPAKSWSVAEYEALSIGEREARLRGLGASRELAKRLLQGPRDAGQKSSHTKDAHADLRAFAEQLLEFASAVRR